MARLIDDMLLLARADMGQRPIAAAPFYLDEIVGETVRSLRVLAQPGEVSIAADCPSGLQIRGDEALIRQMLVNLLENAVRYSRPGGTVRLEAAVRDAQVVIDVADQGPGVPPAERARIFERFVKLDPSRVHHGQPARHGGAGLGLPIARWIAQAHGGSLDLAESGGSGSTFRTVLPLSGRLASLNR